MLPCQVTPGKARSSLYSVLCPQLAPPHLVLHSRFRRLPVTPIVEDPLDPTITSPKAVFFSNNSWPGKHPFWSVSSTIISLYATSSNAPRANHPDVSQQRLSPPTGPSPTFSLVGSSQHTDTSSYYEPELVTPQTTSSEVTQGPVSAGQSQTQGSPPPNKTMFDFVSPFDALVSSSAPARKPAPPAHQQASPEQFDDSWSSVVIDPKRKSVDNLLEQLGSSKATVPSTAQVPPFDQHNPEEEAPVLELVQSKAASRPLPPKPMQVPSPRPSPPKVAPAVRRDVQASEPPLGPQVGPPLSHLPTGIAQREKESSPSPRGSWKGHEGRNRGSGSRAKTQTGPK